MIRYLFALLIGLHGLIHLMGFTKAFNLANIKGFMAEISRPVGLLWLGVAVLLLGTALAFLLQKNWWWILALASLLLSQVLIFMSWQDAKAGTVVNLLLLGAAIVAYGHWNFEKSFAHDVKQLLEATPAEKRAVVRKDMLQNLPPPVQRWLLNSGIVGREMIYSVHLKQKGYMRTSPEQQKWIETRAEQYFTIDAPAFLWKVEMHLMPLVPVSGQDKFVDGKGRMQIKLFSLIPFVDQADEKIDQGALQRYLAEICWFPSAALSPYIRWEAVDASSARASMTYKGVTGTVTFYFNEQGDMVRCIADRYKGGGKGATLEKWVVDAKSFATLNGIRIPVKSEATWKLKEGDFTWYKLEITAIAYNTTPFAN